MDNDIHEDYCTGEVAKLLKQKGADLTNFGILSSRSDGDFFTCTHAVALKWLRINFDIWVQIDLIDDGPKLFYYYPIITTSQDRNWCDEAKIIDNDTIAPNSCFLNPEEAMEAALLYILNNLI